MQRWCLGLVLLAVSCRAAVPAYGEVVVAIETDLAVPRLLSHVRVDLYGDDGALLSTRETSPRDPRDLPASFSVFTPATDTTVWLRVRGYPDGAILDRDVPDPALAVDTLVRLELREGVVARAAVALRGACSGVPSDLAARTTCLDEGSLAVSAAPPVDHLVGLTPGTFGVVPPLAVVARPADGTIDAGEVAVPGGAFVLGDRQVATSRTWGGVSVSSAPPRLVRVGSLLVDAHEVTVGRFRRAVAAGFVPPTMPVQNDLPLPTKGSGAVDESFCTYSSTPMADERERMPISCVTFATAKAFCRAEGADLPTEAEWEYVASAAARPTKTLFPWGDERPTCEQAVFARVGGAVFELAECTRAGLPAGPASVLVALDRNAAGVSGLGGNVAEWTLDAYAVYGTCVTARRDPRCEGDAGSLRVTRGGAFTEGWFGAHAALRKPAKPDLPFPGLGFRCVRRAP